jgi:hypothetical protein
MIGIQIFGVWVLTGIILGSVGVSPGFFIVGGYFVFVSCALLVSIGSVIDGFRSTSHKNSAIDKDTSTGDAAPGNEQRGQGWRGW